MPKVNKSSVNYRTAEDEETRCGTCSMSHFMNGSVGICDLVAGNISPYAVCDKWEPKEQ